MRAIAYKLHISKLLEGEFIPSPGDYDPAFIDIGKKFNVDVDVIISDGSKPIGVGIGPALEARDILRVLEGKGPDDLREKSIEMAGILLEMSGIINKGEGRKKAEELLKNRKALYKLKEIIERQNGDPDIKIRWYRIRKI